MKIYISTRKQDDKYQHGLTIYSNDGKLIDSYTKFINVPNNKFDAILDTFIWGIRKIRVLSQNGKIDKHEPIILFTSSKTLNTWFKKGLAPEPYTVKFGDLLFETNFLLNPTDLVWQGNIEKKVKYQNMVEDKPIKLTELFA